MRITLAFALAAAAALAASPPAAANGKSKGPAYVGTWASQPAQCKADQSDKENAPLIMRRNGYDQHETHCTFSNIRKRGSSWVVRSACSVEGDKQRHTLRLSVTGNRLTMRDEHGARTLRRCN